MLDTTAAVLDPDADTEHGPQPCDEQLAEKLFTHAVSAGKFRPPAIRAELRPAARFSGDVYLAARAPSGEIYVLLGDFADHGLAAAVGALPVSEAFRAMTAKGFAPEQILRSINRKLYTLFPPGMFMAAHFIAIDASLEVLRVANCGMPDMLIFDPCPRQSVTHIVAHSLALGISQDLFLRDGPHILRIQPGTRVLMASDGLFEAVAADGRAFGSERVRDAMRSLDSNSGHGLPQGLAALERFCGTAPQADDITAVEIRCDASLTRLDTIDTRANETACARGGWDLQLTVRGARLADTDPVPLLLNQIHELANVGAPQSALFTVLTELFVNALDHGVLGLESRLKGERNGDEAYMNERARRLAALQDGWVRIDISAPVANGESALDITVSDSGDGFDVTAFYAACATLASSNTSAPSGRGLGLVGALCEQVEHQQGGTVVQVRYPWRK